MKKQDKKHGFTIVEVIVVAVIVLILAGVAIPMYNGYINSARQTTVENLAETAAAAANSYWRKTGQNVIDDQLKIGGNLQLHYDEKKHTIKVKEDSITVTYEGYDNNKAAVQYRKK